MSKIVVIGSSNTDLIAKVKDFPKAGETIKGISYFQAMGGKGANQALAAHRLGGDVKFITSLGKDTYGLSSLDYYKKEGLDASLSLIVDNTPSGVAMIWVDEKGENSIVIISGANEMLSSNYIHEIEKEILEADLIMLQMEIPYDTVRTVCEIACEHNKQILLNVAPARKLDADILKKTHILVVNETEAEIISGEKMNEIGKQAVVDKLLALGAKSVVLTLGGKGSIMKNESEYHVIPAFKVKSIDSTGAGDTFCGALAAELSKGHCWNEALEFASAAAAICVTRMGAQPSIPTETEVYDFLRKTVNY
jgi:ribokinase